MTNLLHEITSLFVYRFKNNDPINDPSKAITFEEASSLNHWAGLFGLDMEAMMRTNDHPFAKPMDSELKNKALLAPDLQLASGLDTALEAAKRSLKQMSFVPVPRAKTRLLLNPSFAASTSGFGPGLLLTSMASNGLTYVNVIDGAPGVVQNIFLSLLNGTKLLSEISHVDSAKKAVYYFAKRTGTASDIAEALMSSDMDNVNRLVGQFTVTPRPLHQRGKDLVIENDDLALHVLYSDSPSIANFMENVLSEASDEAVTLAWLREKGLVNSGFTGYGDWTTSQKNELMALRPEAAGVRGYEAVEIQPHWRYPHLVRDESNYGFVSETLQQRRRKNRHGKSRKYASRK